MRPYIPVEILMKETVSLEKSIAADLSIPDPSSSDILSAGEEKSTKKNKKSESRTLNADTSKLNGKADS